MISTPLFVVSMVTASMPSGVSPSGKQETRSRQNTKSSSRQTSEANADVGYVFKRAKWPNVQKLSHRRTVMLTAKRNCQRQRRLGQLLGIAQRTVEANLPRFKQRFSARKLIPTEVKSSGDYLLLKRIKANLSQPELAQKAGCTVRKIMAWEHDQAIPTAVEWMALASVLCFDDAMRKQR